MKNQSVVLKPIFLYSCLLNQQRFQFLTLCRYLYAYGTGQSYKPGYGGRKRLDFYPLDLNYIPRSVIITVFLDCIYFCPNISAACFKISFSILSYWFSLRSLISSASSVERLSFSLKGLLLSACRVNMQYHIL